MVEMNRNKRITIMCNTHDLKIISASDRVIWIRDGRVDRIETKEEIQVQVGSLKDSSGRDAAIG
jgi:putative ABC transport system ATP-binding protein